MIPAIPHIAVNIQKNPGNGRDNKILIEKNLKIDGEACYAIIPGNY